MIGLLLKVLFIPVDERNLEKSVI